MIELTSRGAQQNVENPALKTVGVGDGYLGINSDGCADPFISRLTPLFSLGGTRQLDDSDLGSINPVDGVFVNKTKLQELWDEECETKGEKRERSLFSVLAKLIGLKRYFLAFLCEFLASGNMFVGPAIMKILLGHLTGTDPVSETNLYLMAAVSLLAPCLAAVASAQSDMILQKASYHMQNGLIPLIFGSLPNNLNMLVAFIMAPFQVGIAMWLLYRELGVALFIHFINKKKEFADKRVKIFNELIAGIRIIKYYAWEKPFSGKLEAIRQNEVTEMSHIYQSWILMNLGNDLTYSNMFASLALFKNMMRPLTMLSTLSISITSAKVAIDRILGKMAGNAVIVDKASFAWEMESVADDSDNAIVAGSSSSKASFTRDRALNTLSGVDLTIKKGHLAAVVGPVGCGKTSLVNAMLGEMYLKEGSVTLGGKVAYHSQEPWILNANIRDNITFENAALTADLKTLPAGLNTEIGERGINVSGGQKARISLARTLYAQADINFLDDPLSAVDANVCDHLFHKAIKGAICGTGKTAVLVTHQVHLLEHCDLIIVLDASGAVRASCPYTDLAKNGVDMSELDAIVKSADDVVDDKGEDSATKSTKSTKSINQLNRSHSLQALDKESNSIRAGSVKLVEDEERSIGLVKSETYLFVLSSGAWFNVALVFIFAIGARVIAQYTVYFMADWGQANAIAEIQGEILSFETQSNYIKTYTAYCMGGALVALMLYHEEMLGRVMRAPISWFDVTPVGRITNRFTGDLFLADFVEITRLFRVSNSPVMVEVNQTLGGMTSIRAYESVTRFQSRLEEAVEKSGAIKLLNENLVPVNYAGPALEFGLETTMLFGALLNTQSNLETLMASVERIHEYSEKQTQMPLRMKRQEPPADWPTEGKIEFADVFMRYRKGPLILKGVDFTISPKEKVGIAGRTASGKSTILVNLFRMEPIEKGRIEIDGIDIASVPVKTLRERLCIIPQDPVMFTETLRRNVDPFDQFSDAEIHDSLITEGGENISTMIHERFKDCTVGELDTPQNLKSRPDGIFARLWSQYESSHHQK
eukprot:GSChrysophyteH1.ASY1.ANO1.1335.1 assembled CDS